MANHTNKKAAKLQSEEMPETEGVASDKGGPDENKFRRVTITGEAHIEIIVNNPGRTGPAIYAKQVLTAEGRPTYALDGLVDAIPDTPEPSEDEKPVERRAVNRVKEQNAVPSKKIALEKTRKNAKKKRKEEADRIMAAASAAVKNEILANKAQVAKINRITRVKKGQEKAVDVFAQVGSLNNRKGSKVPKLAEPSRGASEGTSGHMDVIESGRADTKGKGKAKLQDEDDEDEDDEDEADTYQAGEDDEDYP